jgi:hypothetical protein
LSLKFAVEGAPSSFTVHMGRLDTYVRAEREWPREWAYCREPGSVEFRAGHRVLTISWGRWKPDREARWSAPFPLPWRRHLN